MSQNSGLEMHGLSKAMEAVCRTTHRAFLQQHGISRWPTSVTVIQQVPLLNQPNTYEVQLRCGVPGSGASSIDLVTTDLELDFRNKLGELLDDNYATHQKMKAASN
jgi:hypothetical protein